MPDLVNSISQKTLLEDAKRIFTPVIYGESALVVWFPGSGENIRIRQIMAKKTILKQVFSNTLDKFIIIPIDITQFSYIPCQNWSAILFKSASTLEELKAILQSIILTGKEIVFIPYVFNYLPVPLVKEVLSFFVLVLRLYPHRIHFLNFVSDHNYINVFHENNMPFEFIQNQINIPLINDIETEYFINYFDKSWKLQLTEDQRKQLRQFGGLRWLLKQALRCIRSGHTHRTFMQCPQISMKSPLILNMLTAEEKEVMDKIIRGENISGNNRILDYLISTGIVKKKGRKYDFAVSYIEKLILMQDKQKIRQLVLDSKKHIKLNDMMIENIFSAKELRILEMLFARNGDTVTRDEISDKQNILSNWAIDQHISRIRKKLNHYSITPNTIITVRNEGYALVWAPKI
jgi:DNA-binding winged helix-turn-helix (wHTH) protein